MSSHPRRSPAHVLAVVTATAAVALAGCLTGGMAAYAWGSSTGSAPAFCQDSRFSGSSWYPVAIESRASTYGAGTCFNGYPLSVQLRYSTSGYTIAQTCISGSTSGSGNCQYISTAGGNHTYYKGGRHGLGTTFFLT